MKLFYSELTANPAYYSFGYSVYGIPDPEDALDACYEQGFLPFVGAALQDPRTLYMARGTRVRAQEFAEKHYHARVRRKVQDAIAGDITVSVHRRDTYQDTEELTRFFLAYFSRRFGKEAMPAERFKAILGSPYLTHVVEYRIEDKVVAYSLEVHSDSFVHVWHQAYEHRFAHTHLGIYLYLELLSRVKEAGKQFLYFGVTYGRWMSYKTNFQPLEFWNGSTWVKDTGSKALKALFMRDSTRAIAYVDEWRANQEPYYPSPYPFRSASETLRSFTVFATLYPKTVGVFLILLALTLSLVPLSLLLQ